MFYQNPYHIRVDNAGVREEVSKKFGRVRWIDILQRAGCAPHCTSTAGEGGREGGRINEFTYLLAMAISIGVLSQESSPENLAPFVASNSTRLASPIIMHIWSAETWP